MKRDILFLMIGIALLGLLAVMCSQKSMEPMTISAGNIWQCTELPNIFIEIEFVTDKVYFTLKINDARLYCKADDLNVLIDGHWKYIGEVDEPLMGPPPIWASVDVSDIVINPRINGSVFAPMHCIGELVAHPEIEWNVVTQ